MKCYPIARLLISLHLENKKRGWTSLYRENPTPSNSNGYVRVDLALTNSEHLGATRWAYALSCRLAILHGYRLHDARHTHASIMLKQGIHPKVIQERLGHASIAITLDTYSHVAPGLQEAAAKRFDEAMGNRYNETANKTVH